MEEKEEYITREEAKRILEVDFKHVMNRIKDKTFTKKEVKKKKSVQILLLKSDVLKYKEAYPKRIRKKVINPFMKKDILIKNRKVVFPVRVLSWIETLKVIAGVKIN